MKEHDLAREGRITAITVLVVGIDQESSNFDRTQQVSTFVSGQMRPPWENRPSVVVSSCMSVIHTEPQPHGAAAMMLVEPRNKNVSSPGDEGLMLSLSNEISVTGET